MPCCRNLSSSSSEVNRRDGTGSWARWQVSCPSVEQCSSRAAHTACALVVEWHCVCNREIDRTGRCICGRSQPHLCDAHQYYINAPSCVQLTPQGHKPRVAYQGVPGAYSEGAASTVCPDHEPLPCAQFEVAFQALSQWMADRACIPIENSLGGVTARHGCPSAIDMPQPSEPTQVMHS